MTHQIIKQFEESQLRDNVADIQIGDTVIVHKVIMEEKSNVYNVFGDCN